MQTIEEIKDAIRQLSSLEFAEFREWFAEFDSARWDQQIEADATSGRLDWLIQEAREYNAKRST